MLRSSTDICSYGYLKNFHTPLSFLATSNASVPITINICE
jgi:hypothetical protein